MMTKRRVLLYLSLVASAIALAAAKCYGQTVSAREIFVRYVAASGGESAIRSIKTRVISGSVVTPAGRAPMEIIVAAPDRFLRIINSPVSGHAENGYDGKTAWSRNAGGTREISGAPVGMLTRELHVHRPLALQGFYATLDAPRIDTIGGDSVYVIAGKTEDGTAEMLYFDRVTGLLRGWDVTLNGTVISNRLEDYRVVDGVKIPFRILRARPDFRWSDELSDVKHNVPIDPQRFAKPES